MLIHFCMLLYKSVNNPGLMKKGKEIKKKEKKKKAIKDSPAKTFAGS